MIVEWSASERSVLKWSWKILWHPIYGWSHLYPIYVREFHPLIFLAPILVKKPPDQLHPPLPPCLEVPLAGVGPQRQALQFLGDFGLLLPAVLLPEGHRSHRGDGGHMGTKEFAQGPRGFTTWKRKPWEIMRNHRVSTWKILEIWLIKLGNHGKFPEVKS